VIDENSMAGYVKNLSPEGPATASNSQTKDILGAFLKNNKLFLHADKEVAYRHSHWHRPSKKGSVVLHAVLLG